MMGRALRITEKGLKRAHRNFESVETRRWKTIALDEIGYSEISG